MYHDDKENTYQYEYNENQFLSRGDGNRKNSSKGGVVNEEQNREFGRDITNYVNNCNDQGGNVTVFTNYQKNNGNINIKQVHYFFVNFCNFFLLKFLIFLKIFF